MELGLGVESEISGRALADCYYMVSGGLWWSNVLNSALPPRRLRPDTHRSTKTVSATRLQSAETGTWCPGDGNAKWCSCCRKQSGSSHRSLGDGRPARGPSPGSSRLTSLLVRLQPTSAHPILRMQKNCITQTLAGGNFKWYHHSGRQLGSF